MSRENLTIAQPQKDAALNIPVIHSTCYVLSNTIVLLLAKDLGRMIILFSWIANSAPKMQKDAWMNELIGRASGPKQELIVTLFLR